MGLKIKPEKELKALNDKNLLSYYKAERKRFYKAHVGFICECCGDFIWHIYDKHESKKELYENWQSYLNVIKIELNTRSHIERPKHK